MKILFYILSITFYIHLALSAEGDFRVEMNLKSKLLGSKYDKDLRPRAGGNDTTHVNLSVALIYINELDEKNEVLTTHIWMRQKWVDFRLKWDPQEQGQGINKLRIPADQVWTPEITLYNSASTGSFQLQDTQVVIDANGTVSWTPSAMITSYCNLDLQYYPLDKQTCMLMFGSWIYDSKEVDLVFLSSPRLDFTEYHANSKWMITGHYATKTLRQYQCCEHPYPDISYYITLERRDIYYSATMVAPCVMIIFLLLLVFWLPPDSQEKITLGSVAFIVLAIFMVHTLRVVPVGSDSVPHVVTFYVFTMVMLMLTLAIATLVISIFHRGPKKNLSKMPNCLRCIFIRGFGCLLCLGKLERYQTPGSYSIPTSMTADSTKPLTQSAQAPDEVEVVMENATTGNATTMDATSDTHDNELLRYMAERDREEESERQIRDEWKTLAYVLDRLFFWIYFIIFVICIIALFCREDEDRH